jgi:hypothetical protein
MGSEGAMKQKFYVVSALSVLCILSSVYTSHMYGCPLCIDAAGNVDKPFFYEDEEGRTLGEKGCCLGNR